MNNELNIEKLNRMNFRHCLEAMSRPGTSFSIQPLADSAILAVASLLLYSEVCFFQALDDDWKMVKALTGARETTANSADYLFVGGGDTVSLEQARRGDQQNPEFSATLVYKCTEDKPGTQVLLNGPGINGTKKTSLPVSSDFLHTLARKNRYFPLGVDLFFLRPDNTITGLPRTTVVEVQ